MLLNKVVKKITIFLILFFSLQIMFVNATEKIFSQFSTVKSEVLVLLDASKKSIPIDPSTLSLANASHFDQDDQGNLYILNVDEATGTTNIQKLSWEVDLFKSTRGSWVDAGTIPSYLNRDSDIAWGNFKKGANSRQDSLVVAEGNQDFEINSQDPYDNCRDKTAIVDNQNVKENTTCLVFSRSSDLSFVQPTVIPSDASTITTSIKQQYLNDDRYEPFYENRNNTTSRYAAWSGNPLYYSLENRITKFDFGTFMESPTACSQDQISSKNGFVVKFYCVPKEGVDYNSSHAQYDYRFIVYEPDLNGNIKTEFGLNIPFIDSKHIWPAVKPRGIYYPSNLNSPLKGPLTYNGLYDPSAIKCSLDKNIGIKDSSGFLPSSLFCTFLAESFSGGAFERLFVKIPLVHYDRKGYLVSDYADDTLYQAIGDSKLQTILSPSRRTVYYNKIANAGEWRWTPNGQSWAKKIGKGCMLEGVDITTDLSNENTFYVSCDDWYPNSETPPWDNFWKTHKIPSGINSIKKITSNILDPAFGQNGTLISPANETTSVTFSNIKEIKSRNHPIYGDVIYVLDKGLGQIIVIGTDGSLINQIGAPTVFPNLENNTDTTIKSLFTSIGSSADLGFGFYQAYDKTEPFTNITATPAGAVGECDSSGCLPFSIRENGHLEMENISISASTRKISSSRPSYDIVIANQDTDWPSAIRFVKNYFTADINSQTCSLRYVVIFSESMDDWDETNDDTDYLTNQLGLQFIIVTDKIQEFDSWNATRTAVRVSSSSLATPTDTPEGIVLNSSRIINIIKGIVIPSAGSQTSAEQSYTAPIIDENNIYLSSFEAYQNKEWDGFVRKYTLDPVTKRAGTVTWNASFPSSRNIWTVFPNTLTTTNNFVSANSDAIIPLFTRFGRTISSFSHCTGTTNAEGLINFIRGQDHFDYDGNGNCAEERNNILSDIYHSQLVVVGPPDARIDFIRDNEESYWRNENDYKIFKATNASREKMVYVASNSGLLHAFSDSDGEEKWAFLPPFVAGLMPTIFTETSNESRPIFSLDGSPVVHDTFFNDEWRTVLIIPYGRGGAGFSALNITDPDSPTHLYSVYHDTDSQIIHYMTGTEYNSYNYTDVPANLDFQKLGETWSNPKVVFYNDETNDRLGLVMGAGYIDPNNTSDRTEIGNAVFVLDINNGTIIREIPIVDNKETFVERCSRFHKDENGIWQYGPFRCVTPPPINLIRSSTPNTPLIVKQNPDPINGTYYKGAMVYINDIEGSVHKINLTDAPIPVNLLYGSAPDIDLYGVNTIYGITDNHKHTFNTTNGRLKNRRNLMFHPLEAAYFTARDNNRYLWFFTGTGDGNDMERTTFGEGIQTSPVKNILIGMKDTNQRFAVSYNMTKCDVEPTSLDSNADRTEGCQPDVHILKNRYEGWNWQINMGSHKLSGTPIVNNGTVYFPIYKPATGNCDTGSGYICATRADNGMTNAVLTGYTWDAHFESDDIEKYFMGSGRLAGYGKISKITAKEGYLIYSNSINPSGSSNTMKIKSLLGNGKKIVINSYQK